MPPSVTRYSLISRTRAVRTGRPAVQSAARARLTLALMTATARAWGVLARDGGSPMSGGRDAAGSVRALGRQAGATFGPPASQDPPPRPSSHADAEPVGLLPLAVVRLIGALQLEGPFRCPSDGLTCVRGRSASIPGHVGGKRLPERGCEPCHCRPLRAYNPPRR